MDFISQATGIAQFVVESYIEIIKELKAENDKKNLYFLLDSPNGVNMGRSEIFGQKSFSHNQHSIISIYLY